MMASTPFLTREHILARVPDRGLFREGGIPWLVSPCALKLPKQLRRQMETLGGCLGAFQRSSQLLYQQSAKGKQPAWIAESLDKGKPDWLIDSQRRVSMREQCPSIIRPDLIWCEDGLAMTELDSVPGGMGITHFLMQLYREVSGDTLLGGSDGILRGWRAAYPEGRTVALSEESADYRAEMSYLVEQLGDGFSISRAEDLDGDAQQGAIYRFFELFDTEQIPAAKSLLERAAAGELLLDPPPIAHLEEKAWLALFHCPSLQEWWRLNLRENHRLLLEKLIPRSWLLDPTPLPPHAALPWLNLPSWQAVGELSQKARQLVLKISGFSELAWGARGVYIGHDMPQHEWKAQLAHALSVHQSENWVMQQFHEGEIIEHPYYHPETGELCQMKGRVRLCPYYFKSTQRKHFELGGCLATIVPADKKKIHGMRDAILVPTC